MNNVKANQAPQVLLVCDGSSTFGFGHIRRSLALYEYLTNQQIVCHMVSLSADVSHYLPSSTFNDDDIKAVIFDLPYALTTQVALEQSKGRSVICLDCLSETPPDLSLFIFQHDGQKITGKNSVGYQHVMIRDEFFNLPTVPNLGNDSTNNVLVTLGGADVNNMSESVCTQLLTLGYNVDVVIGPLAKTHFKSSHENLTIHIAPDNFPQLMNNANWCVVNGGGSLFEALFLKKPCVVLPQTPAEQTIANDLSEKDQILAIGLNSLNGFSDQELQQCRQKINVIDGLGLARIHQQLLTLLTPVSETSLG